MLYGCADPPDPINTPLIVLGSPVMMFLPIPIPPHTCRAPVDVDVAGVDVLTNRVVFVITCPTARNCRSLALEIIVTAVPVVKILVAEITPLTDKLPVMVKLPLTPKLNAPSGVTLKP